jgi:serine/threonine-protein kinase
LTNASDAVFCIGCGLSLSGVAADDREDPAAKKAHGYLQTGALVDGKYQVEKILGEGGMGVVYLARDIHTETPVVVKAIRAQFADRPEFRARTLAEGRALARIDHPNVVRLNAVVVEQAALYLVMQFIDGEALDKMIERHIALRTPIPLEQVLSMFRMILQGVGAAHAEGLIHRDLKPANILIRKRDGVAKVTDFGIAKGEDDAKAGRGVTKGIIGSLSYMAPEQVRGQRDLDKRVDIYSLGIMLFELLIGRVPFDAPSDYEIMRMHAESPLPSVSGLRPDVPRYIDDAVQRACAKDRDQRFHGTDDFLAALHEPHAARPITAPLAEPPMATAPIAVSPIATAIAPAIVTPPAAPASIAAPRVVPIEPARGETGEGASLPPGPRPEHRTGRSWSWLIGGAVAIAAAGASAIYFLGSNDTNANTTRPAATEAGAKIATVDSTPEASAPPSPLAALVGTWRSTSNRDFVAALAPDDTLEFRIQQAAQHPRTGYENGEVRFRLSLIAGSSSEFAVEDHLRPTPPAGVEYDPQTSHESCVGVWTTIKGKKLLAQYDGASTLTVDVAQIRTTADKFKTQGKKVVSCVSLGTAPAEQIESKLSRVN